MAKEAAVLVGLKQVDPQAYNKWNGEEGCWGCELDVDNIERILQPLNYDITVLKTAKATRSAICNALKSAASSLRSGDTFVFYYSGHGGQQPDQNGDEVDGHDETLLAYDGEIIDDELNAIWTKFRPGVRIVMLSDSCNSGTNYRNLFDVRRSSPIKPMDEPVGDKMRAQMIHFGGCRDGFGSIGYQAGGAFTVALCEIWKGGDFRGTYPEFHDQIRRRIRGQDVQYNEYGPVGDGFRNQRPFSPASADAVEDSKGDGGEKATASAGGVLLGPRFGDFRGSGEARGANGAIAKQSGVDAVVRSALAGKITSSAVIRYGDGTYYLPTLSEVRQLLNKSQGDRRTWTAERFDCDDFSYVLKGEAAIHSYDGQDFRFGLCIGIIWGYFDWVNGYHAVNWFVDNKKQLYLIEPQTDVIYPADRCTGGVSLIVV